MITFSLQDVQNLVLAVSLWPPLTEPAQSGFPAEGRAHGGAVVWRGHPAGLLSAQRACRFCWIPGPSLLLTFSVCFLAQTFKLF